MVTLLQGPGGEVARGIQACRIGVALPENLVGSQTQVAASFASSARSFPRSSSSRQYHYTQRRNPDGFEDLCRWVALLGD
jgi:hypothetical protein